MQIAIFGLGRMGGGIARRLHRGGHEVLGWNRSEGHAEEFRQFGGFASTDIEEVVQKFTTCPRIFWVMLPQDATEDFLFGMSGIYKYLKPGDIVIDGGNSFYKDSVRRGKFFEEKGIHFFDSGTSGGVWGEERGFALMVGGKEEVWSLVVPIFKTLSGGENYGLVGDNGAGHFVKMVHNGIEYGMMQAIGEGFGVLEKSSFDLDLAKVARIYQSGSVISSWLIDLTCNIFEKENITETKGIINSTGEGAWTQEAAVELGVSVPVLDASLKVRTESLDAKNQDVFSNKIVALLRKQFGGHEVQ
jgi:6-phosphogluconate dehydrogenase